MLTSLRSFLPIPKDRQDLTHLVQRLCHYAVLFYVFFLPYGRAFREIGSATATSAVILVYAFDYSGSNLRRFRLKWLFFLFYGFLIFKTFHSIDIHRSWYALRHASYQGILLFLAGIEAVRCRRDARNVVFVFAAMCLLQGLVGIYQYFVDFWIPFFTPEFAFEGRLTGTFHTPRVGNLMAISLPVLFALPLFLTRFQNRFLRRTLWALLFSPGLFLLLFSFTRSGQLGFVAAVTLAFFLYGSRRKPLARGTLAAAVLLAVSIPLWTKMHDRFSSHVLLKNPRIEIWGDALEVFSHYPLLGSGLNTFLPAKKSLGIVDGKWSHITHPHGTYFQLLAEMGIVGFLIYAAFAAGLWFFALHTFRKTTCSLKKNLIAAFLCAYSAYLVASVAAHDFLQAWWIGLPSMLAGLLTAMTLLSGKNDVEAAETNAGWNASPRPLWH